LRACGGEDSEGDNYILVCKEENLLKIKKNKLSVYLIKSDFKEDDEIVKDYVEYQTVATVGTVYLGQSQKYKPKWADSFFSDRIDTSKLFSATARAVLLVKTEVTNSKTKKSEQRYFAVTMGYGRSMLQDNVIEERFGLKVVINSVNSDNLRKINVRSIGGTQKLTNEQLPTKSQIADFGINIERDIVNSIAGNSSDISICTGMISGGDVLSLSANKNINNIVDFLKYTYEKYTSDVYLENFSWIDHIRDVKDKKIIRELDIKAVDSINDGSKDFWMAVPEIIEWQDIEGFDIGINKNGIDKLKEDLQIDEINATMEFPITDIQQLKNKQILAIGKLNNEQIYHWSTYKCLYGEISLSGDTYCISNGKWYCVDANYVEQVKNDYNSTKISDIVFDNFTSAHKNEAAYSIDFAENTHRNIFALIKRLSNMEAAKVKLNFAMFCRQTKTLYISNLTTAQLH
jgi:uncharacterized protein (TIGR04141 family)